MVNLITLIALTQFVLIASAGAFWLLIEILSSLIDKTASLCQLSGAIIQYFRYEKDFKKYLKALEKKKARSLEV